MRYTLRKCLNADCYYICYEMTRRCSDDTERIVELCGPLTAEDSTYITQTETSKSIRRHWAFRPVSDFNAEEYRKHTQIICTLS